MVGCPGITFSLLAKVFAKGKMFWYTAVKVITNNLVKLSTLSYDARKKKSLAFEKP